LYSTTTTKALRSVDNEVSVSPKENATFKEYQDFEGARYIVLKSGEATISINGNSFDMTIGEVYNLPPIIQEPKNAPMIVNKKYQIRSNWNLVAFTKDRNISEISDKFDYIYAYRDATWVRPVTALKGEGVWIHSKETQELASKLGSYSLNANAYENEGWQLLGTGKDMDISEVLTKTFTSYIYSKETWMTNPDTIYKGQGFWVHHKNGVILQDGKMLLSQGWNLITNVSENNIYLSDIPNLKTAYSYVEGDWVKAYSILKSGSVYMLQMSEDTYLDIPEIIASEHTDIDTSLTAMQPYPCMENTCKVDYDTYDVYILYKNQYIKNPSNIYKGQGYFIEKKESTEKLKNRSTRSMEGR